MAKLGHTLRGLRPLEGEELARLSFHGAAGGVTGSCHLVETRGANVLLDCGMHQGGRDAATKNRRRFPFPPEAIDAVVLSHAHIDHSGLLPKLVRDGFQGRIHVTRSTASLLRILLLDAAHIQEQDARYETRRRLRHGRLPVEPLYEVRDAERALERVVPHPYGERFEVAAGQEARFSRAEHILGAASVELFASEQSIERKLVFSGDVGRYGMPILRDPEPPREAELALMESTYGDRDHRPYAATLDELASILTEAAERGGKVIVPVFAVGRAQELLYHLGALERAGRIPARPVFLDSPMAIDVTALYAECADELEPELARAVRENRASVLPKRFEATRTPEESMKLNERTDCIVLAASGMCEAGRIVHHLKHGLWRPENHVVIVGFQAPGTNGRALVDGAKRLKLFGEPIAVRAQIHTLGGFSAHAGRSGLVDYAKPLLASGARLALVHGEERQRRALAEHLRKSGLSPKPILLPREGDGASLMQRGAPVVWRGEEV